LALGPRQTLSRQTAWGCLTTNLAMPGFGSLAAGHVSGYVQAVLAIGGMILTVVFGARFILWYVANWSRLHDLDSDPTAALGEMWLALRWPALGIGIFFVGWLWALVSSCQILRSAQEKQPTRVPPRLS
jgi:hypothetical protein